MGEDVFYSGTVAAAIEGTMQGVPAIAASLVTRELTDFVEPAQFVARLARQVLERGLPRRQLLNVNMPHRPWERDPRRARHAARQPRVYQDTLIRKVDPARPRLLLDRRARIRCGRRSRAPTSTRSTRATSR